MQSVVTLIRLMQSSLSASLAASLCVLCAMPMMSSAAHAFIPDTEIAVLDELFASTDGANWRDARNWAAPTASVCLRVGVICNAAVTHVTGIQLIDNGLNGTLPATLLNQLPELKTFSVSKNRIRGTIPAVSGLAALRVFDVNTNLLSGAIPALDGLIALQTFDVAFNGLTGSIPALTDSIGLLTFNATSNQLTGSIPSLVGLTVLDTFDVFNNQLTGSIPVLVDSPALRIFNAANNQLTGFIPSLTGLTVLRTFDVHNNQLAGSVPVLAGLSALRTFAIETNQLTGTMPSLTGLTSLAFFTAGTNQLTGSIPELNVAPGLGFFKVNNNQLSGAIPSLAGLPELVIFNVSSNKLTGALPPLVGVNPVLIELTNLELFDAHNNQLSGPIPSLTSSGSSFLGPLFRTFDVSNNQLTGSIPDLTNVTHLQRFAVSDNRLTGAIPTLIFSRDLRFFDAHNNKLTGSIPRLTVSGAPTLFDLQTFDVSNNQLTGSIPTLTGPTTLIKLQGFNVSGNQLTGAVPAVPSPSVLVAEGSLLCPNQLTVSPDAEWDAATPSATWNVGCTAALPQQVLTFGAAPTLVVGGTSTVTATVTPSPASVAPIVYSSATPDTCSVDAASGLVIALPAGVQGNVCTIAADKAGDTTINSAVQAQQSITIQGLAVTFTVTPSTTNGDGLISPDTVQTITSGNTATFTVTPNTGFNIAAVNGTCGGALTGNSYTTNVVVADCTVIASFVAISAVNFIVTPSTVDTNGSINPNTAQAITSGNTTTLTITPNAGFNIASVDGTCGGALTGNSFTTNPITADCTVIASFVAVSVTTFIVAPGVADTNGTINPSTPQTITSGSAATFTITPNAGFFIAGVTGTCGGVLTGGRFTTNAISADCTVNPSFALIPVAAEGVAVPTLSQWTLMLLALLVFALAAPRTWRAAKSA
jgi:Leucine-rich repeat (LRR) protein